MIPILKCLVLLIVFPRLVKSAREPPEVTIPDQGTVRGTYLRMFRIQTIIGYLGLPYAHPPLVEKRFAPPLVDDLPSWSGVRNASKPPPDCWQSEKRRKKHDELFAKLLPRDEEEEERGYDEDCLYLNVYVPDAPPPPDGFAVIVWLHSGDFTYGSPFELNPFQLVMKQKVIVVTVAYRLNIFGFLTTIDGESPGNFGLMDQSAALLWVNKNIKLFQGNDSSITLMGHGAGGVCTALHLTSGDWSEGMFHRVVIMSPTSFLDNAIKDAAMYKSALDRTAKEFGCDRRPTSKLMICLRRVTPKTMIDTAPDLDWGPVLDNGLSNTTLSFIPEHPRILIEKGLFRKIPVLIGYTDTEEGLELDDSDRALTSDTFDTIISEEITSDLTILDTNDTSCDGNSHMVLEAVHFLYRPFPPPTDVGQMKRKLVEFSTDRVLVAPIMLFATQLSRHVETFVYRFDMKPNTDDAVKDIPTWMGVPHKFDQIYVWGLPYFMFAENKVWETADKRISDIIMTMWANYVKYGNPTELGIYIRWENFTQENPGVLIIDRNFNMSDPNTLNYRGVQFWNDYYPKVIGFAASCCNGTFDAADIPRISRSNLLLTTSIAIIQLIRSTT